MNLPKSSFMERIGQFQKRCADEKKEVPDDEEANDALRKLKNLRKREPFRQGSAGQFFQAGGAQNPVVMFRNAFAAEKLPAFRAAGHCFADGMVETPLMGN
jgi:hypothetical protein